MHESWGEIEEQQNWSKKGSKQLGIDEVGFWPIVRIHDGYCDRSAPVCLLRRVHCA